jgi:hypothetical protein
MFLWSFSLRWTPATVTIKVPLLSGDEARHSIGGDEEVCFVDISDRLLSKLKVSKAGVKLN